MPHSPLDKGLADLFDVSEFLPDAETNGLQSEAGLLTAPDAGDLDGRAGSLSEGTPAEPLFGRLPLARVVPQDVHSVMDHLNVVALMGTALATDCPRARTFSVLAAGGGGVVNSLTDYRLSLAKVIPIEKHEAVDYAFGISAIVAPFVFGYRKSAPAVAALHVALGLGTLLVSLFTDYRAYRGVGRRAAL